MEIGKTSCCKFFFNGNGLGILLILFLFPVLGNGQDIHFSQFQAAPTNISPGFTGQFNGDHRFIANQRTQWRSVTTPYSTFAFAYDTRKIPKFEALSGGLSFFRDQAGDSQFSTLKIGLSGGYEFQLPFLDSLHHFNGALQVGFVQKKLVYDELNFDNQYNGYYYDPSRSTGESISRDQRSYPDLSAGLGYTYRWEERKAVGGGIGLYNLLKPKQSMFNNGEVKLDRRFNLMANGQYPLDQKIDLLPALLYSRQGKYQEFLVGARGKYILKDHLGIYRAVFLGLWWRTRDATFITLGMDYDTWHVGISYDINLSDLQPASRARGGFEFSVRYILRSYEREELKHRTCPTFL